MYCVQVLEIVRSNYDSLTLKMQDSLDQFERYSEKPKETTFFSQLVCSSFVTRVVFLVLFNCRVPTGPGKPWKFLQFWRVCLENHGKQQRSWKVMEGVFFPNHNAYISGTTHAIFTKFFLHVAYVRGLALLRHVYDRLHRLSPGRGFLPH